jgi:hypothetical protein
MSSFDSIYAKFLKDGYGPEEANRLALQRIADAREAALEAARKEAEAIREYEASLITLECPSCLKTVGCPPGTYGRCFGCARDMKEVGKK